jgi:hypothetical protein
VLAHGTRVFEFFARYEVGFRHGDTVNLKVRFQQTEDRLLLRPPDHTDLGLGEYNELVRARALNVLIDSVGGSLAGFRKNG